MPSVFDLTTNLLEPNSLYSRILYFLNRKRQKKVKYYLPLITIKTLFVMSGYSHYYIDSKINRPSAAILLLLGTAVDFNIHVEY